MNHKRLLCAVSAAVTAFAILMNGCVPGPQESASTPVSESETVTESENAIPLSEENFPAVAAAKTLTDTERSVRAALLLSEAEEKEGADVSSLYDSLLRGDTDVILVPHPSRSEDALSEAEKAKLVYTVFANEGLVFFTHPGNPVRDLSRGEIVSIFAGEIANWSEVGGEDMKITPCFQEAQNASSSAALLFGIAPGEGSMMLSDVDLHNDVSYIGFTLFQNYLSLYESVSSLLSVGEIAPNDSTIRAGEYPFLSAYAAVSKSGAGEETEAYLQALVSRAGQVAVRDSGLSPVTDVGFIGHEDNHVEPGEFSLLPSYLYRQDSILFEEKHASYENVGFFYPSVDGLLDADVEETLNLRLFSDVLQAVKTLLPLPSGSALDSETELVSAFQNTISVKTRLTVKNGENESEKTVYGNYELLSGRKIAFSELFNRNCDRFEVLPSSLWRIVSAEVSEEGGVRDTEEALMEKTEALFDPASGPEFFFDEQTVTFFPAENGEGTSISIRLEDVMRNVAIYHRFASEDQIYDGKYEKQSLLPVFLKRNGGSWAEIVSHDMKSYVDAAFYCNVNSESSHAAALDVRERLNAFLALEPENGIRPYIRNVSATMYEMGNATIDGHPASYYVTVLDYVLPAKDTTAFITTYQDVLAFLRSERAKELRDNLFLPTLEKDGVLRGEPLSYRYVTWYYASDGSFLGEK